MKIFVACLQILSRSPLQLQCWQQLLCRSRSRCLASGSSPLSRLETSTSNQTSSSWINAWWSMAVERGCHLGPCVSVFIWNLTSVQSLPPQLQPIIILTQRQHADLAGKITGMLLEIDNSELLHMLEDPASLQGKVHCISNPLYLTLVYKCLLIEHLHCSLLLQKQTCYVRSVCSCKGFTLF